MSDALQLIAGMVTGTVLYWGVLRPGVRAWVRWARKNNKRGQGS